MRIEAVNNTIVILKEHGEKVTYTKEYMSQMICQVPPPYMGVIDSIGESNNGYSIGDKVAFSDIGGVYLECDNKEYVIITPDMVIGKMN